VKVWRFPQLEALPRSPQSRRPRLYLAAIEEDGDHAVAAFDDQKVRRFALGATDELAEFSGSDSLITGLAVSRRDNRLLLASNDWHVRIEEGVGSGKKTLNVWESRGRVWGGAFAPDGMHVVTCASDGKAQIWRMEKGACEKKIELSGHTTHVTGAAWSPDSKFLATSSEDETVRVWDVSSGDQQGKSYRHDSPVFAVAWSPDGQQIATSSLKYGLRVWKVGGVEPELAIGVGSPLIALKFLDKGRIVGISEDGATHSFLVDVKELQVALEQSNRDCLSPQQRETYLLETKDEAKNGYADCERLYGRTPMLSQPAVEQATPTLLPDQVRDWLEVVPGDATVEVDGVRVRRRGGLIGLVDNERHTWEIRVVLGAMVAKETVVLQKGTLSPSKIDLFKANATQAKPQEAPTPFDTEQ